MKAIHPSGHKQNRGARSSRADVLWTGHDFGSKGISFALLGFSFVPFVPFVVNKSGYSHGTFSCPAKDKAGATGTSKVEQNIQDRVWAGEC
jgi:hypothetical protein